MSTIYFRTFEETDLDSIYQWMNDDDLKKLSVGLNRRMSREECRSWLTARINHSPYAEWWAICSCENNKMIGYACLTGIHYINRSADFSGIMICDKNYQDGVAWIETYLFILEYAFERLNMNRLYCHYLADHRLSSTMADAMFFTAEGIEREAIYKNGTYHDLVVSSILAREYYGHKNNKDFETKQVIKRLLKKSK